MTTATIARELAMLKREITSLRPPPPLWSDPIALAGDLGVTLDVWQADVLTSTAPQILMLCARQAGKSLCASLLALFEALCVPASLTLILSPGERQSGRLFRTMLKMYRQLGHPVAADVENRLSLELANGSEVHALPGSEETVRGFGGVNLLIEDEAAVVPDELYMATRPMLATSNGRIVLLSTPRGKRGHLYTEWVEGGAAWKRVKVTAEECPRIPAAWLEQERNTIGEFWFQQEYGCRFVDTDDQLYATDLVEAALSPDVVPLALPAFLGGA